MPIRNLQWTEHRRKRRSKLCGNFRKKKILLEISKGQRGRVPARMYLKEQPRQRQDFWKRKPRSKNSNFKQTKPKTQKKRNRTNQQKKTLKQLQMESPTTLSSLRKEITEALKRKEQLHTTYTYTMYNLADKNSRWWRSMVQRYNKEQVKTTTKLQFSSSILNGGYCSCRPPDRQSHCQSCIAFGLLVHEKEMF